MLHVSPPLQDMGFLLLADLRFCQAPPAFLIQPNLVISGDI
jgi:hypothetical protein